MTVACIIIVIIIRISTDVINIDIITATFIAESFGSHCKVYFLISKTSVITPSVLNRIRSCSDT